MSLATTLRYKIANVVKPTMHSKLDLTSALPDTSFAPFRARRLRSPEILWVNPRVRDPLMLELAAACLPVEGEIGKPSFTSNDVPMLAERYGGEGLGRNGGGARCGLVGGMQVKGVGRNPLAASDTDFFHSYGGATIAEAILEAIWGEVIHSSLPSGGARVLAIIGTGTKVPVKFPRKREPIVTRRVLIVRQPILRAGHFMRAIYSNIEIDKTNRFYDTTRTVNALQYLPLHFFPETNQKDKVFIYEHAVKSVDLFLERSAVQIATARVKRIMHGSLTASNISIDGGWHDFASISALSDYGRILLPRGSPDFLHEEELVVRAATDLLFYIEKYLGSNHSRHTLNMHRPLISRFRTALQEHVINKFILLTGLPEKLLKILPQSLHTHFSSACIACASTGTKYPFRILSEDNEYSPIMPEKMGEIHLNSVLIESAYRLHQNLAVDFDNLTKRDSRVQELRDAFRSVVMWALATQSTPSTRAALLDYIVLNAIRRNSQVASLYRTVLYDQIKHHADSNNIAPFIDSTCNSSIDMLRDDFTYMNAPVDIRNSDKITIHPFDGITFGRQKLSLRNLLTNIPTNSTQNCILATMSNLHNVYS